MPSPTERFSSRVDAYVRSRPGYPPAILDVLRQRIGLSDRWAVADIGSGTGISSEPFLQNGNTVFAVEPNRAMRAAAEAALGENKHFHSLDGTAESTGLAAASVDLLVAGQAFHWFDRDRSRQEFDRILKTDGVVLLMWNARRLEGSPFLVAYEKVLLEYGTDYAAVRHENTHTASLRDFFARDYGEAAIPNPRQHDLPGLLDRVRSSSYVPAPGDPGHAALLAEVTELFHRHQVEDRITMDYDTLLYWGRL